MAKKRVFWVFLPLSSALIRVYIYLVRKHMCSSHKKSRDSGLTLHIIIVKTIMEREFSVYQASWILNIHCIKRVKFRNWNSTSDSAKNEHGTYRFLLPRHLTFRLCLWELGRKCAENTLKGIDNIETWYNLVATAIIT